MRSEHSVPAIVDLTDTLTEAGDGVHWTLDRPGDLNVNLVRLDAGHAVDEHVNEDVDVLVVVVSGGGLLAIDGTSSALGPNVVAHVPRGARRRIQAGSSGLGYLTVHRRRTLTIAQGGVRR